MSLSLGIDTGGTYTDAVLVKNNTDIVASAKSLTTKEELTLCIRNVVEMLPHDKLKEIQLVSLSTTLATNAIVERRGEPICLMLIGYPKDSLNKAGLHEAIAHDPVVFIQGGHTVEGEEQASLDTKALEEAIKQNKNKVKSFAVSGYFSVKNPEHEIAVKETIRKHTNLPVTCGYELSNNLHASRRALTVVFNARLIPLIRELLTAVRKILNEKDINAPLMIVKGDGSLVSERYAYEYPVETILSGPAASVVGALHFSGIKDGIVVDMGGTTTDISVTTNGLPEINKDGAIVGNWHTMIEAIKIHTFGIGGDSKITINAENEIEVGPERVIPLSYLGFRFPDVLKKLKQQRNIIVNDANKRPGVFYLSSGHIFEGHEYEHLTAQQKRIAETAQKPVSFGRLLSLCDERYLLPRDINTLVSMGYLMESSFTPTDACHILGEYSQWSKEAASVGASIHLKLLNLFSETSTTMDEIEFASIVKDCVIQKAVVSIIAVGLEYVYGISEQSFLPFKKVFRKSSRKDQPLLKLLPKIEQPITAIGAPVRAYFPEVANQLQSALNIPEYADVANAFGAVIGRVVQRSSATIVPMDGDTFYRVYLPDETKDFEHYQDCLETTYKRLQKHAEKKARVAGANEMEVHFNERKNTAETNTGQIFVDHTITAIAVGKPFS